MGPRTCEANVNHSILIERELRLAGHNPYNPLLLHYTHKGWEQTLTEDEWHKAASEWLRFCDAVLVATPPAAGNSGVQREIEAAQIIGIPVYYSIGEIL